MPTITTPHGEKVEYDKYGPYIEITNMHRDGKRIPLITLELSDQETLIELCEADYNK